MPRHTASFADMRDKWPSDEIAAKQWLEEQIARMKREGIFAEVVTLTPAMAKEFLERNADNRPIRQTKLKQVVDEINGDRFMLNGETIIFADTGVMNDGQHRCAAVIETMKPIDTVVVFGVSRESRRTVDNGAARSPGDHLAVEGLAYATDMASIGRFVLAWEASEKKNLSNMSRVAPTAIVERCLDDRAMQTAAEFGRKHYTKAPVAAPSVIGFAYYAFAAIDKQAAEEFLTKVVHGHNLAPESAAYQVRETLLAMDRPVREHRVEYLFAGFVAHRAGLPLGRYKIKNELVPLVAPVRESRASAAPSPSQDGKVVTVGKGKSQAAKGRKVREPA